MSQPNFEVSSLAPALSTPKGPCNPIWVSVSKGVSRRGPLGIKVSQVIYGVNITALVYS
jgi:hypothetical protein